MGEVCSKPLNLHRCRHRQQEGDALRAPRDGANADFAPRHSRLEDSQSSIRKLAAFITHVGPLLARDGRAVKFQEKFRPFGLSWPFRRKFLAFLGKPSFSVVHAVVDLERPI